MMEVRIKGKNLDMPEPINWNMGAQEQALTFYTTKNKLNQHEHVLKPSDRIGHLTETCNLGIINDNNMKVLRY